MNKTCSKCGITKARTDFYARNMSQDGLTPTCIACIRAYQEQRQTTPEFRAWRRAYNKRPERREKQRRLRRQHAYGIDPATFDRLLASQGSHCLICRREMFLGVDKKGRADALHVDHDHSSGKVRGLLCGDCNRGLGCFRDSPEALQRAASYLKGTLA